MMNRLPLQNGMGCLVMSVALILTGCSTSQTRNTTSSEKQDFRITSTKVRASRTGQRVRLQAILIEIPPEITKEFPANSPFHRVIVGVDAEAGALFESLRKRDSVVTRAFPILVVSDGERVVADGQEQVPGPDFTFIDDGKNAGEGTWAMKDSTKGVGLKWSCLPTIRNQAIEMELNFEYAVLRGYHDLVIHDAKGQKKSVRIPLISSTSFCPHLTINNGGFVVFGGMMETAGSPEKGSVRRSSGQHQCLVRVEAELRE